MDEVIEISDDEVVTISDSDDSIIVIEDKSNKSEKNENSPGPSRQGSTDREIESNDEIDWDRVRLPTSGDESEDEAVASRIPNPMIPG